MRIDILPLEYNQKLMLIHYYQLGLRPNSSFTNYLNPILLQQKCSSESCITLSHYVFLVLFTLEELLHLALTFMTFCKTTAPPPHTHTPFFFFFCRLLLNLASSNISSLPGSGYARSQAVLSVDPISLAQGLSSTVSIIHRDSLIKVKSAGLLHCAHFTV